MRQCELLERAADASQRLHGLTRTSEGTAAATAAAGGSDFQASFPFFKRLAPQIAALDQRLLRHLTASLRRVLEARRPHVGGDGVQAQAHTAARGWFARSCQRDTEVSGC